MLEKYKLESKVKREFNQFFKKQEEISIYAARKKTTEGIQIRKRQLEVFYGYVLDKIELAEEKQLKYILSKPNRRIKRLYEKLEIEPYEFTKFTKEEKDTFKKLKNS